MKTWHLHLPVSKQEIEELSVGDIVYLSGRILTITGSLP